MSRKKECISPLATRPILYTDTVYGNQALRDDLWAVTTEELNAVELARQAHPIPPLTAPAPQTDELQAEWSRDLQSRLIELGKDQDDDVRNVMAEAACLLVALAGRSPAAPQQSETLGELSAVRDQALADCLAQCEAVRESGCESKAGAIDCINAILDLRTQSTASKESSHG